MFIVCYLRTFAYIFVKFGFDSFCIFRGFVCWLFLLRLFVLSYLLFFFHLSLCWYLIFVVLLSFALLFAFVLLGGAEFQCNLPPSAVSGGRNGGDGPEVATLLKQPLGGF